MIVLLNILQNSPDEIIIQDVENSFVISPSIVQK